MRELAMFICFEDQFVDTVEDLLFGCGPCRVAASAMVAFESLDWIT
jgi:hypothetical protein